MSNGTLNNTSNVNKIMAAATLVITIAVLLMYKALPIEYQGARTTFGKGLGITALALALFSMLYSLRRIHMKYRWGKLEAWLQIHIYTGLLALLFALIHSNWRFQPGAATTALILLFLTDLSGIVGWVIYIYAPSAMSERDGEKYGSPDEIYARMDKIRQSIETLEHRIAKAGNSDEEMMSEISSGVEELKVLDHDLKIAMRREEMIGIWLNVHIPISAAFIVVASVHGFVTFYL